MFTDSRDLEHLQQPDLPRHFTCCHSQFCHMMIPIRVPPPPPQTSVKILAGMDPEDSLHRQQNCAFTTAAAPYSIPTGHRPNCSRKMVFSVSGTELHQHPFPATFQDEPNRQDPGPRMFSHTSSTSSNLKHNFSSSPPIFQDYLGTLKKKSMYLLLQLHQAESLFLSTRFCCLSCSHWRTKGVNSKALMGKKKSNSTCKTAPLEWKNPRQRESRYYPGKPLFRV